MRPDELPLAYLLVLAQLAVLVLALTASWRLAGWLWPEPDWGQRVAVTALLFCALAVVVVIVPGLLGLLHPLLVAGLVAVVWGLCWRLPLAAPLPPIEIPGGLRWCLFLVALVIIPFAVRAVFFVELGWDSITYHLFFPASWIRDQRIYLVDGVFPYNYLAFYPKNYELLQTFLMVVARNDLFTKFVSLPLLGLSALMTGLICRQLGGSAKTGWCAALFALTIPPMFCWAAVTYVEPLLNFCLLSAVYFVLRAWQDSPDRLWRSGILAGLAVGLAAGAKYSALYEVVLLCLIVGALPLLRRLPGRTLVRFTAGFAACALLTGVWWFAVNAAVTGNPVYPVAVGNLPAIAEQHHESIHQANILNNFGQLWSQGWLQRLWFCDLPPLHGWPKDADGHNNYLAVGPDMEFPSQLGLGLKVFFIAPCVLLAVGYCLLRGMRRLARRDLGWAAASWTVAASILALLYTYLKIPYWDDIYGLFSQVRFAMPFVLLSLAAGFALLARLMPERCLPALVMVGTVCDALILDLRFTPLNRVPSFCVLLACGLALYLILKRGPVLLARFGFGPHALPHGTLSTMPRPAAVTRRAVFRLAALSFVLALLPLLSFREAHAYWQWENLYEVHLSSHPWFASAAEKLERQHPGEPLAYAGNFASFLYLFSGRKLDRPVFYVPTYAGPVASYLNHGELRDKFDRDAWVTNLKGSGAKLLLVLRFCDRQKDSSYDLPVEAQWADELGFPILYDEPHGQHCRIYQVIFSDDSYLPVAP